ncbi:hypothetical protein HNQ92_001111 [Rhabdobacter roseus]|uniref:Uncharacterized protein n=1 Tax=Rhabdobacter roseus TaxID=1655419 RepID=A0A840TJ77_9BACT|nr:hypothetical protein [Rhabdobacter roseus]
MSIIVVFAVVSVKTWCKSRRLCNTVQVYSRKKVTIFLNSLTISRSFFRESVFVLLGRAAVPGKVPFCIQKARRIQAA